MRSVETFIKDTQGYVPDEYEASLLILADNYNTFLKGRDVLINKGSVYELNGRQFMSPIYNVVKQSEKTILDILKQFGLTSLSRKKLCSLESDNSDDYLDELVN